MRLLFDQNLSPRLVAMLADLHAGSTHVRNEGLQKADDDAVWVYAIRQGFVIGMTPQFTDSQRRPARGDTA